MKAPLDVDGGVALVWKTDWNTRCWRSLHGDATAAGMLGYEMHNPSMGLAELRWARADASLLSSRDCHQLPAELLPKFYQLLATTSATFYTSSSAG